MKEYNQYPTGPEGLRALLSDLVREYKRDHPEEAERLKESPPQWYGPLDDGLLAIGKSIFVIRNNKIERELPAVEVKADWQ